MKLDIKKKLPALLVLAMLTSALSTGFVGCSEADGNADTPSNAVTDENSDITAAEPEEETEAELSDGLAENDFGGASFRMLIRNDEGWIEDMYSEELNGEIMNDVIYERNNNIGERFNFGFELIRSSNSNYETDGINSITAGDNAYEIIMPHARASFIYAQQGLVLDWKTDLPNVNLNQPWWDQGARDNFSIGNKLYMMIGDISYKNLGATDAMLFNKQLFDDLGLEYPYQLVNEGKWTFDKFAEYAGKGTIDLNGDGKIEFSDDQIGYVTDEWLGPIQVLYSGNQRIVNKDENDIPYLSLNTPKTVEIFEKYFALLDSEDAHCADWEGLDTSVSSATGIYGRFARNQAIFLDTNIRGVIFLRNMDANFGLVPWPKFDETVDKYYSNVDAGCSLIIVPLTIEDSVYVSTVLEALCCEGRRSVIPAYFDVALSSKYARDEESANMLSLVKEGRVYDLGYYNNDLPLNSIGQSMYRSKNYNFSSTYKSNEKVAEKILEKMVKAFIKD